ncbi:hypothetical protein ACA910_000262 [Epithemia clementina (nom. ined.)]
MQSVLDSLCRCFGEPVNLRPGDLDHHLANTPATTNHSTTAGSTPLTPHAPAPATPDAKRRTKNMKLQEEQWDALFDCNAATANAVHCVGGGNGGAHSDSTASGKPPAAPRREDLSLEQAQAVAKAKLAANGNNSPNTTAQSSSQQPYYHQQQQQQHPSSSSHRHPNTPTQPRRKRASPEDIFRSKKNTHPNGNNTHNGGTSTPHRPKDAFSRFLTNNPVLANSLCFATPVRDPADEEPETAPDNNSVVSDTNTLNTAEDTITSTLYYEQVKLAGLKQKNPPMPLFGAYEVKPSDDIRKVVTCESYSSAKMKDWVLQNPEMLRVDPMESHRHRSSSNKQSSSKPKKNNKSKRLSGAAAAAVDEDEIPPDMVNSSSESTGRSV